MTSLSLQSFEQLGLGELTKCVRILRIYRDRFAAFYQNTI